MLYPEFIHLVTENMCALAREFSFSLPLINTIPLPSSMNPTFLKLYI